ncbi:MAG: hypothetical protein Q8Q74_15950, partial [Polaromonas sp.]|nr:hypothetical protein [Polaromonas sp.]
DIAPFLIAVRAFPIIENSINHDRQRNSVRPELVEGLRQAQPERCGVRNDENSNSAGVAQGLAGAGQQVPDKSGKIQLCLPSSALR